MIKSLLALLTRQNNNPTSIFERVGDYFITPLAIGFSFLKFNAIKQGNRIFSYEIPRDFLILNSRAKYVGLVGLRMLGILLSPLAIVGFTIKLLGLVHSKSTRKIYFNWVKPASIEYENLFFAKNDEKQIARMYNNKSIIEEAIATGKASLLLQDIYNHPRTWLIHYVEDGFIPGYSGFGNTDMSLTPDIKECVCCNSGHFNRFINHRRQNIEAKIAQYLSEFNSVNSLSYLSLGANGFLQELMIISRILAKKLNANIHLVDPTFGNITSDRTSVYKTDYSQGRISSINESQLMVDFVRAAAKEEGIEINFQFYKTIDDVPAHRRFDMITAIDFDDIFNTDKHGFKDVCEAQSRLRFGGRLYLSYDKHDFVYNQSRCIDSNGLYSLLLKGPMPTKLIAWEKPNLSTRLRRTPSWPLEFFEHQHSSEKNQSLIQDDSCISSSSRDQIADSKKTLRI